MACDSPIVMPANDPCAASSDLIGQQVVGILVQDMAGTAPTFTNLASLQTALTATGANQVFILTNLAASTVPDATDVAIEGNEVPYGARKVTQRTRVLTSRMQYLTTTQLAVADDLGARQTPVRHWEYDNLNRVQGPFENSSIGIGTLTRAGIGGAVNGKALVVTTVLPTLKEPHFLAAAIPGINALQNV